MEKKSCFTQFVTLGLTHDVLMASRLIISLKISLFLTLLIIASCTLIGNSGLQNLSFKKSVSVLSKPMHD